MKGFLLGPAVTLSLCASGTALFRQQATVMLIGDAPIVANVRIGAGCNASVCVDRPERTILKGVNIDGSDGRDGISFKAISSDMAIIGGCGASPCAFALHR